MSLPSLPISSREMAIRGLFPRQQGFLLLILAAVGVHFSPVWRESKALERFGYHTSMWPRSDLISLNRSEPPYIQLWPTFSHLPCNLTLRRTGISSGFLEHRGNCQGFIASIILTATEGDLRQTAEITMPNKITWHASMGKVDKALLTLYTDVLPHELLGEVEWVKDDTLLYYPKVMALNVPVIDDRGRQTYSESMIWDEKYALQQDQPVLWENRTLRGLSRKFDMSCYHSTQFKKIWIVGTSESRRLFEQICFAVSNTPAIVNKTTTNAQCGNVYFVNMCQWYCGCDFTPFFDSQPDLSEQLVSVSCGLHGEFLKDSTYWVKNWHGLNDWAIRLKKNQTKLQFRVSNAVNPFKTTPEKIRIARNNFRYQNFRDIALSTLGSDVHVIDAFRVTEPVFDLSEDHVHFPAWVYGELARMFFKSLCDMEQ